MSFGWGTSRFPFFHWENIVGSSVPAAITYLFRTTFDTAANQPFTDGQVITTEAEGMLDGTITARQVSSITNGEYTHTGSGTPSRGDHIVPEDGRVFYFKYRKDTAHGFSAPYTQITDFGGFANLYSINHVAPTGCRAFVNAETHFNDTTFLPDGVNETLFVVKEGRIFIMIKRNGDTNYTLLAIGGDIPDTISPAMRNGDSRGTAYYQRILVPETLYTDIINTIYSNDFSSYTAGDRLASGLDDWYGIGIGILVEPEEAVSGNGSVWSYRDIGVSDCVIEGVTESVYPASNAATIIHGRLKMSSPSTYWQARQQGGAISLREGNSTVRASNVHNHVSGENQKVRLWMRGDTLRAEVVGSQSGPDTTSDYISTANQNETGMAVYPYLSFTNEINVYPLDGYSFEAPE